MSAAELNTAKKAGTEAIDGALSDTDVAAVVTSSGKIDSGLIQDRAKLRPRSNMVEAAGVEPASEIHVSKETPCVVDSGDFALRAQNRQDARNASPMISSLRLGPRPRNQPAVRRSSATHRRSHGERLLI
jgi:hypothetical protein